jgi:hypothetical protein
MAEVPDEDFRAAPGTHRETTVGIGYADAAHRSDYRWATDAANVPLSSAASAWATAQQALRRFFRSSSAVPWVGCPDPLPNGQGSYAHGLVSLRRRDSIRPWAFTGSSLDGAELGSVLADDSPIDATAKTGPHAVSATRRVCRRTDRGARLRLSDLIAWGARWCLAGRIFRKPVSSTRKATTPERTSFIQRTTARSPGTR